MNTMSVPRQARNANREKNECSNLTTMPNLMFWHFQVLLNTVKDLHKDIHQNYGVTVVLQAPD